MKQSHYFQDSVLFEQAAGAAIRAGDLEGASYLFRQAANAARQVNCCELEVKLYDLIVKALTLQKDCNYPETTNLFVQATWVAYQVRKYQDVIFLFEQAANAASLATEYTRATYLLIRASSEADDYGDEQ